MGDVNVRQLFGGKTGNRGKGRPKGSRNKMTLAEKARLERERRQQERDERLADLRATLEEERLRRDLDDFRTPRRQRQPARSTARTNQDVLVQVLAPIAAAFAPAVAQMAGQMMQGPKVLQEPPAALPAPQQQAPEQAAPTQQQPPQPTGKPRDSIEGKFLRSMCEQKGAQGLAAWLVTADDERAQVIVQHICTLPDEQLPQLWASVVQGSPGLAAFCAWLQAWPKYPEAVQAVRMLRTQQQQQAAGAASPPA